MKTLKDLVKECNGVIGILDLLELMRPFTAHGIGVLFQMLTELSTRAFLASNVDPKRTAEDGFGDKYAFGFEQTVIFCEMFDLPCSLRDAKQLLAESKNNVKLNHLGYLTSSLRENLKTEMSALNVFVVDNKFTNHLKYPTLGWEPVIQKWPDSAYDIEHATKCLALSEWTACVFHLSRIAEYGLRMACKQHIPDNDLPQAPNQTMGKYLMAIDAYYKANSKATGRAELLEASTYFRPVKDVWRDNVSHTGMKYDGDEAERCYNAVRDMLIICSKLL